MKENKLVLQFAVKSTQMPSTGSLNFCPFVDFCRVYRESVKHVLLCTSVQDERVCSKAYVYYLLFARSTFSNDLHNK